MDKLKVLIVDDHMVVVEGIRSAIADHPDFEVAGTASDGADAVKKVKALKPDLVVMDISMPNLNGIEATRQIKQFDDSIRIIILTMYSEKEYIISLFMAGVSGYVLKEEPISDLILALEAVRTGGTYYSRSVQQIIRGHMEDLEQGESKKSKDLKDGISLLSLREKEIFPLLADGLSVRDIADRLCISPKTVESHKYNIMEKLNARSIADLTKMALKKNLIKI